jgi:hypothetical protein
MFSVKKQNSIWKPTGQNGPSRRGETSRRGRAAERFGEHLRATIDSFGQYDAGLLRPAGGAIEPSGGRPLTSGQFDPLGPDIAHVCERSPRWHEPCGVIWLSIWHSRH